MQQPRGRQSVKHVPESGEAYQLKSYVLEAARRFGPAGAELEFESEFEEELEAESEGEL